MKLSIERGTLLKALAQAQSVVERRNTIPILANVLIRKRGEQVSFLATDIEIQIETSAAIGARSSLSLLIVACSACISD